MEAASSPPGEGFRNQAPQMTHALDHGIDCPVDYVAHGLNVFFHNPLQANTEEGLPRIAIISRMQILTTHQNPDNLPHSLIRL